MANPTTNYGFVLPTATDLVTDLPADFDVALQGVDTRLKALQPGTTAGDLFYASATANVNTRLGIGSTAQLLTVASGIPSWATPAGATASWSQLGVSATTSGTTVTVSGLSGYNQIYVQFENISVSSAIAEYYLRMNTDSGANYNFAGFSIRNSPSQVSGGYTAAGTSIYLGRLANASNTMVGGILINGANNTAKKFFQGFMASVTDLVSSDITQPNITGTYDGTSVISSVSIVTNGTAFDAGNIRVFGSVA